jgi:hypothetical protein
MATKVGKTDMSDESDGGGVCEAPLNAVLSATAMNMEIKEVRRQVRVSLPICNVIDDAETSNEFGCAIASLYPSFLYKQLFCSSIN